MMKDGIENIYLKRTSSIVKRIIIHALLQLPPSQKRIREAYLNKAQKAFIKINIF